MDHYTQDEVDKLWGESDGNAALWLLPHVLAVVNDIREVCLIGQGTLETLPPGVPKNAERCVLAVALSNGWEAQIENSIDLYHREEELDFAAMVNELAARGYDAAILYDSDWDEGEDVYVGVGIAHTPATNLFIKLFDQAVFPDLILND